MADQALQVYVLSVRQPYALAIVNGWKAVENRRWRLAGPVRLLVHASTAIDHDGVRFIRGLGFELPGRFVRGAIIGTVIVSGYITDSPSKWAQPGMWHWQLTGPVPALTPIPCRGHRRLFTPPPRWRDHFPPLTT
jgi:hypothetical protein